MKNGTSSATAAEVLMLGGSVDADEAYAALTDGWVGAVTDARDLVAEIARALEPLAAHPIYAARLARAGITVTVDIVDSDPPTGLTLLLDRTPIEITTEALDAADVLLLVPSAELHGLWHGDKHLPTLIATGKVGYLGPVRRLLRVLPVLRRVVPSVIPTLFSEDDGFPEERA